MERAVRIKTLGSGTYGKVHLVRLDGLYFAQKEVHMNELTQIEKQRALNEIKVLSRLTHHNIIKYQDSTINYKTGQLLLLMDYAECGDLARAIKRQRGTPFGSNIVLNWFVQITLALQYIHFHNILHRDLKPQNIFLYRDNTIKVGDFGITRVLANSQDLAHTGIGTPYYLSPEMCMRKPYNSKSDMWALGCVLFELSALTRPFKAENFPELVCLIVEGKRQPFPSWSSVLEDQLVEDLLSLDPKKRPSTGQLLDNPLLQKFVPFYGQEPKDKEPLSALTKTIPPAIVVTEPTPRKSAAIGRKLRSASTQATPPSSFVTDYETENKMVEKEHKPRSASTRAASSRRFAISISPPKCKATTSEYDSKPVIKKIKHNDTYSVMNETNIHKNMDSKSSSASTPNDCGYSSEEICSADSTDSSICEHSINSVNEFSILKGEENGEKSIDQSHCQHSQCHQCMIDMMWKNRIRGGVSVSRNNRDYLKLKKKLLLIFEPTLFQKVYKSLLNEWEGSKNEPSKAPIRNFAKRLNYEQVQNLPLMMQLIQLDLMKMPNEGTNLQSDELVML